MKVIPYYDEEDYFQTGIIVLWNNIERVKNNHKIAEYFLSYYAVSVSHAYANLFRDFVMKNDTVIEIRVNDGSGYNIVRVKSFQAYRDKLKRRKKEYYETHREQIRERDRKRREEKKKQKIRKKRKCEQSKKYYAEHRDEINRKRRESYAIKKQIKLGCHSNLEGEEH
jgi:hypothetical protein